MTGRDLRLMRLLGIVLFFLFQNYSQAGSPGYSFLLLEPATRLELNDYIVAYSDEFYVPDNHLVLEDAMGVDDPLEGMNRCAFTVNDALLLWLVRPLTRGYSSVVPRTLRQAVNGVARNIEMPVRVASCLCQAKFKASGIVLWRFLINSTIGLGGSYDAALTFFSLREYDEDFGQVFASWGIGPGFYLVLPIEGSTTMRDAVGLIFDYGLDPKTYLPVPGVVWFIRFNKASLQLNEYKRLVETFNDPYWVVKDFWYMLRRVKISE